MMTNIGAIAAAAPNQPVREFDNFQEMQTEQKQVMLSLMRRVEDLADRVLGPVPTEAGSGPATQPRSGHFGNLLDESEDRDAIIRRTSAALSRIEHVL